MKILQENSVEFTTSLGVELEARLVRLGRFDVGFEVFSPDQVLRTSEILAPLKINLLRVAMNVLNKWRRKSLGPEFAAPAAQGCGPWRSSFWTERTEASHG